MHVPSPSFPEEALSVDTHSEDEDGQVDRPPRLNEVVLEAGPQLVEGHDCVLGHPAHRFGPASPTATVRGQEQRREPSRGRRPVGCTDRGKNMNRLLTFSRLLSRFFTHGVNFSEDSTPQTQRTLLESIPKVVQLCTCATLYLCNFVLVQLCTCATLYLCNFVLVQLCTCATLYLCNLCCATCTCRDSVAECITLSHGN